MVGRSTLEEDRPVQIPRLIVGEDPREDLLDPKLCARLEVIIDGGILLEELIVDGGENALDGVDGHEQSFFGCAGERWAVEVGG